MLQIYLQTEMLPIPDALMKLPKRPRVLVIILAGSVTVLLVFLLSLGRDRTTLGQGQMQIPEPRCATRIRQHAKLPLHILPQTQSNKSSKGTTPTITNTRLTTGNNPAVLYYNTHGGTNVNMKGIMKALNLDMSIFNPKQVTGYGMSGKHAAKLITMGHVSHICEAYDVVVIGDTIPHGRALMQSLLEWSPAKQCRSVVMVEMTNRFDWDIHTACISAEAFPKCTRYESQNGSRLPRAERVYGLLRSAVCSACLLFRFFDRFVC
ncbi:hypothetical protein BJ741DRAFT_605958 [Chytriomyces cf. hyalinus JEL632]|nr:hypothetical protein BJ741DRAFT_605958 [Chytriomyces cf. hyalinus JEL632]